MTENYEKKKKKLGEIIDNARAARLAAEEDGLIPANEMGEEPRINLVDMAEIVANAKINSTKKPSYQILLTHLSPCRISKDANEIAKLEVLAAFVRLI